MAVENFTTYTETDPNSHLSKTATVCTATGLLRNEDAYIYKDMGLNYFNADFSHSVDVNVSAATTGGLGFCWMMANDLNDFNGIDTASGSCLGVYAYKDASTYSLYVIQLNAGVWTQSVYSGLLVGTTYYLVVRRDETVGTYGTIYLDIYSNAARTNLIASINTAIAGAKRDYRYIYAVNTFNDANASSISFTSSNLDLQDVYIGTGILSNIVAFWPFGDAFDSPYIVDISGKGNHLTPYLRLNQCTVEFRIGTRTPDGALGLDYGLIQQVYGSLKGWGKWNRMLSPSEKTALYGKEYWPFSTTTSLQDAQAYYLLDEVGGSTTYTDSKGNNNLTASGITTQVTGPTGSDYATRLCTSSDRAKFTASVSGTVLTVTAVTYGTIQVGMTLAGNAVLSSTVITSFGTGSGGTGTYNLNQSQTLSSGLMIGTKLKYLAKTNPGVELQSSQIPITIVGWVSLNEKPATDVSQMQQVFWGQLIQSAANNAVSGFNVYYDPTADRFCYDQDAGDNATLAQGSYIVETVFGSPTLNTWYFLIIEYDSANNQATLSVNNGTKHILSNTIQPLQATGKIGFGSQFLLNPAGGFSTRTSGWDVAVPNGNSHVSCPANPNISIGNNSKTVWGWFKTTTPTADQMLAGFFANGANDDWSIQIVNNFIYFIFGNSDVYASVTMNDTNWHLVMCWYDKIRERIYIDLDHGAATSSISTTTSTPQVSTNEFRMGADSSVINPGNRQFQGILNLWGIANGTPTQADKDTLWNNGNGWILSPLPPPIPQHFFWAGLTSGGKR